MSLRVVLCGFVFASITAAVVPLRGDENSAVNLRRVPITTPGPPPAWALVERHVLDQLYPAAEEFVTRYARPDGSLNLTSTSLMANAWMHTGDEKYRQWVVDYVRAWLDRVHENNGILPDNSVRYFDPVAERPGVPPDVAVLVERLLPEGIRLQLVNLHPTEKRRVILQAGMFGEHEFTRVRQVVHYPHQFDEIHDRRFEVELVPGAVGRLEIDLRRYVNAPTCAFPWQTAP